LNSCFTNLSSERRDRISIIAEVLEMTMDGALKTQIRYRTNLSFGRLDGYLELLLKLNLIEKVGMPTKIFTAPPRKARLCPS
jgi:predicted transcriptional regulator